MSAVVLGAFGAPPVAGQDARPACPTTWSKTATACAGGLVVVEKPFQVRAIEGTLADQGGATWAGGVEVVIELAEAGRGGQKRVANAELPSGKFRMKDVRPGEYCFRVGVQPPGWSCVEGRIIVSEAAPPEARVDIVVPLGK